MSPVPPCYLNSKCFDHDRLPQWEGRHVPGCTFSATGRAARANAIDALTPAQMRTALHSLSGYAPIAVELVLDDADARRCAECREDAPWHTAQCTLRPGAEPVATILPEHMPEGAL